MCFNSLGFAGRGERIPEVSQLLFFSKYELRWSQHFFWQTLIEKNENKQKEAAIVLFWLGIGLLRLIYPKQKVNKNEY